MIRIVDDLLDVSRVTQGKIALQHELVSVATLLGQAVESTRPLFEALRTDTQVFAETYATVPGVVLHTEGRRMAVTLVTADFFPATRVAPAMGRGLVPDDDAPTGGRPVLVLSHKGWERHFQRDLSVIGRTVLVNFFASWCAGCRASWRASRRSGSRWG